jgi:putative ABC transport system permease protein
MFKNYLTITLRNFLNHKTHSLINIFGLALGLTICILILLWVQDEIGFDRFHINAASIYRVVVELKNGERSSKIATTPAPLAALLKEKYPEIISYARIYNYDDILIQSGDQKNVETNIYFADPAMLDIFSFPLSAGDPRDFHNNKYSILLTPEMARKYFGEQPALGKTLHVEGLGDLTIAGIFAKFPVNSQLQFDFIAPISLIELLGEHLDQWDKFRYFSYIQLRNDTDPDAFAEKISTFFSESEIQLQDLLHLQPLISIHFDQDYRYDMVIHGDLQYVYIFSLVALIVLILACINFMNLSTARYQYRGKEVGIRKMMGATRRRLIGQFLGESMMISSLSLLGALLLVELFLPAYNSLTQKHLNINYLTNLPILLSLLTITLFTGFLSGSYPALFLSSLKPVSIFKNALPAGLSHTIFRKILVITQFIISVVLIVGTIVVYQQMSFIRQSKIDFEQEQIIYLLLRNEAQEKFEALCNDFQKIPGIHQTSASMSLPFNIGAATSGINWPGKNPEEQFFISFTSVDYDFLDMFGIQVVEGRGFSREFTTDRQGAFIINQVAARKLGIKEPVGAAITFRENPGKIIGIVKDFHFHSLRRQIDPVILGILPEQYPYNYLFLKIPASQVDKVLPEVEKTWQQYQFKYPLDYRFLDESFENMYRSEKRVGQIFFIFATLAILISCLGLFGLASFVAEQRTKEIGIRKVMGASASQIVVMLSSTFIRWVLLANLIAWPLAYLSMNKWLQNFAYRIDIGWSVLAAAGLLSIVIALFTVSWQAIRAANTNPVRTLRYE